MAAIPGEPLDPKPPELTMSDGRKVVLKGVGIPERVPPGKTEERGQSEPPRDDVHPPHNPLHGG